MVVNTEINIGCSVKSSFDICCDLNHALSCELNIVSNSKDGNEQERAYMIKHGCKQNVEQSLDQNIVLEHVQNFASICEQNNASKSKQSFEAIVKPNCEQILVSTFVTHRRVGLG